jgi:hypothetical protein
MAPKIKIFLISFLFLISFFASAYADEIGVSAQALVDRATILIGERVRLTVDVTYRAGIEIDFPDIQKEDKLVGFEIKDSGRELKDRLFGDLLLHRWYYITSYSTGAHQIPQIEIKYRAKGAKDWKAVQTQPLKVTVVSVLPKGKEPADIKDVKGPLGYFEINWFVVCGVIILFIILALAILYRFRKVSLPPRLPHETALEELEAARGEFLRNSDMKGYYAGISDCVRRYIEKTFKLKAPEMTTEQFLGSLRETTALSLDQKDLLKNFLNACDLVKFAKYSPAKPEMESVFLAAKKFIEETKEIFMPKAEAGRG